VTREFYYFKQKTATITNNSIPTSLNYTVSPININDYSIVERFWDFKPSWQNSFASINRFAEHFVSLGIFEGDTIVGYCVFEPGSGDITQIAVDREYRRRGIGTLLFQKILESLTSDAIKLINTDISCNSITAFLESKQLEPAGKQYEMVKKL
jgi:Acetyltransferase (GNAT) family.